MDEEETFECEECGKSFDSQRGLSIHKSQMHSEEETQESEDKIKEESTSKNNSELIAITTRQALIAILLLGLSIGFSTGLMVSEITGPQPSAPSDSNENIQAGDDSQIESGTPVEVMREIANSMDLDGDQIASCTESSDSSEISEDRSKINEITGGIGTPTFFIGNSEIGYTEVTGAQPYSRMKGTIDQKIEEANSGDTSVGSDEYSLESISFEGEPTLGDKSAPINIIEYSDYGCPWCAEWHGVNAIDQRPIDKEDSFKQVRSNFVETGDAQFVFKDYPVARLHPQAETAHKAANCVLENSPEDYWEFSQKIYEERDKW